MLVGSTSPYMQQTAKVNWTLTWLFVSPHSCSPLYLDSIVPSITYPTGIWSLLNWTNTNHWNSEAQELGVRKLCLEISWLIGWRSNVGCPPMRSPPGWGRPKDVGLLAWGSPTVDMKQEKMSGEWHHLPPKKWFVWVTIPRNVAARQNLLS